MATSKGRTMQELLAEFQGLLFDSGRLMAGSTDIELQRFQITTLNEYIDRIKGFKRGAIADQVDEAANLLFHMQCFAQAVRSIFELWVSFKEGDYAEAWGHMIDAEEYNAVSAKASVQPSNPVLTRRLEDLERVLFPSFAAFFSAGFTETIGDCSICGTPFGDCDHLENHIYCGCLCRRVNRRMISPDHVAFVDDPKDRRCIISVVENEKGQMVSRFTGKVSEEDVPDSNLVEPGRRAKGVMMTFSSLDFD